MKRSKSVLPQWALLVHLALSFYMVGQIWLTQVSCYPLWAYVGPAEYHAYHVAWWHSIWGVIFVPGGLVTVGAFVMLRLRPLGVPGWAIWLGIILQVLIYGLTAVWWGRLMAEMDSVSGPVYGPMYHQLMTTHWGRVAIVTAYGVLQLWMVSVSSAFRENDAKNLRQEFRPLPAGNPSA